MAVGRWLAGTIFIAEKAPVLRYGTRTRTCKLTGRYEYYPSSSFPSQSPRRDVMTSPAICAICLWKTPWDCHLPMSISLPRKPKRRRPHLWQRILQQPVLLLAPEVGAEAEAEAGGQFQFCTCHCCRTCCTCRCCTCTCANSVINNSEDSDEDLSSRGGRHIFED